MRFYLRGAWRWRGELKPHDQLSASLKWEGLDSSAVLCGDIARSRRGSHPLATAAFEHRVFSSFSLVDVVHPAHSVFDSDIDITGIAISELDRQDAVVGSHLDHVRMLIGPLKIAPSTSYHKYVTYY
jgi:hypothetical protein